MKTKITEKAKGSEQSAQRKRPSLFLLALCAMLLALSIKAWSQQPAPDTSFALCPLPFAVGYLVAIDNPGERLQLIKTTDIVDVYTMSEVQFPNNCIEWGKELSKSVFYQLESRNRCFYVEVKKIDSRGHYRRISNREFEKLTKNHK